MTSNFDAIIIIGAARPALLSPRASPKPARPSPSSSKLFGGTCVNTGCIPTKTLIASAHAAHLARRAQDFGVHAGPVTVDMKAVKARKDAISGQSRTSVENSLDNLDRCTVFRGQARFESPTTVRVGLHRDAHGNDPHSDPHADQVLLSAPKIFVNVGGRATIPDLPGVHDVPILTNSTILDPPLGRVGLTETEVRAAGRPALIATHPMSKVGRAVEKGETQGFMKVLVDAETKRILGAAILGASGDEAIHTFLDIMYSKAPYTTLQRAMHIHPTVSELIPTLLGDLKPLT